MAAEIASGPPPTSWLVWFPPRGAQNYLLKTSKCGKIALKIGLSASRGESSASAWRSLEPVCTAFEVILGRNLLLGRLCVDVAILDICSRQAPNLSCRVDGHQAPSLIAIDFCFHPSSQICPGTVSERHSIDTPRAELLGPGFPPLAGGPPSTFCPEPLAPIFPAYVHVPDVATRTHAPRPYMASAADCAGVAGAREAAFGRLVTRRDRRTARAGRGERCTGA